MAAAGSSRGGVQGGASSTAALRAKLRAALERNKIQAAQELEQQRVDAMVAMFQSRVDAKHRAEQAVATKREADIDAVDTFAETLKKRQVAEAKARLSLQKAAGAKKPALSAPKPINLENPAVGVDTAMEVPNLGEAGGPQPLAGAGGSPQAALSGVGGGPPPTGLPNDAGQLLGMAGQVAPFLVQQTQRQGMSLEQTMPGVRQFVPRQETTTRMAPNVLTAGEAASLQLDLAIAKQKSFELYLDKVAQMVWLAEHSPGHDAAATRELMALRGSPALLGQVQQRVATIDAAYTRQGILNPKAVLVGGQERWMPSHLVGGMQKPFGVGAGLQAIGGALAVTRSDTNKMHDEMRVAGDRLWNLIEIGKTFRPEYMTWEYRGLIAPGQEAARKSLFLQGLIDTKELAAMEAYNEFRTAVDAHFRYVATAEGGKTLTRYEAGTVKNISPQKEDSDIRFYAKWKRAMIADAAKVARYTALLKEGQISEDTILDTLIDTKRPELRFEWGNKAYADVVSPGEQRVLQMIRDKENEIAMEMRTNADRITQKHAKLDDAAIRREARSQALYYYNLPPVLGEIIFGAADR